MAYGINNLWHGQFLASSPWPSRFLPRPAVSFEEKPGRAANEQGCRSSKDTSTAAKFNGQQKILTLMPGLCGPSPNPHEPNPYYHTNRNGQTGHGGTSRFRQGTHGYQINCRINPNSASWGHILEATGDVLYIRSHVERHLPVDETETAGQWAKILLRKRLTRYLLSISRDQYPPHGSKPENVTCVAGTVVIQLICASVGKVLNRLGQYRAGDVATTEIGTKITVRTDRFLGIVADDEIARRGIPAGEIITFKTAVDNLSMDRRDQDSYRSHDSR